MSRPTEEVIGRHGTVRQLGNPLHAVLFGPNVALDVGAYHLGGYADLSGEIPLGPLGEFEPVFKLHAADYGIARIIVKQ